MTEGAYYAKLRRSFRKAPKKQKPIYGDAMKPYIAGLLWLGLGVCLFDVRLALAQRPFPSPNNPDEEQRAACNAMI